MGRLNEILKNKVTHQLRERGRIPQEVKEQEDNIKMYNNAWLLRITDEYGYIVNRNRDKAQKVLEALNRKNGYCPCGGEGNQYKCPCHIMRNNGICKCGLFENVRPVSPEGRGTTARIKEK